MSCRGHSSLAFTGMLWLGVLLLVGLSLRLGHVARFVPLLVGAITLVLLTAQLVRDMLAARAPARRDASGATPPALPGGRARRFLWVLCLPVLVFLLGFALALPLHAFVYLRGLSHERWGRALGIPLVLIGLVVGIRFLLPAVPLWQGWLWPLLSP